ncbi:MAG: reverse transcriptase family protein [Polyangiaceae bacterium]
MAFGKFLIELKALLVDPSGNKGAIEQLLRRGRRLAEFEVLRHYATSKGFVPDDFEARVRSRDPRVRCDAAARIDVVFPRTRAGRFLRMLVKDPDAKTRTRARRALKRLELGDVALPDRRYEARRPRLQNPGAWNPSGWLFGLHRRSVKAAGAPDRIAKRALPALANVGDLVSLLGLEGVKAIPRLTRAGVGPGSPYVEFEIDKASGAKRPIAAPRAPLRKVQRKLLREILDKVPVHDAAHVFVRGRSTVTNAAPHERAALVVKMDLVDFFPTLHFRRVRGLYQELGYSRLVAHVLASLSTYRPVLEDGAVAWPGVLPQGAPTSPALANLACRRLDARLAALAKKSGARYTRYADDLTFSFDAEPKTLGRFLWWVDQICQQEGFSENARKRRVLRRKNQQRITGVVVNSGLFLPRRDRHRFRAILANVRRHGLAAEAAKRSADDRRSVGEFVAWLRGFAAYAKMVQPELGAKWVGEVKDLTSRS